MAAPSSDLLVFIITATTFLQSETSTVFRFSGQVNLYKNYCSSQSLLSHTAGILTNQNGLMHQVKQYHSTIFCAHENLTLAMPVQSQNSNLLGAVLRVSTALSSRSIMDIRQNLTTGKWFQPRSLTKYVVDYLVQKHNFTPEYIPSSMGHGGRTLPNGTWVGVVGDLLYGHAEMGCLLLQTFQRSQVVSFSTPITMSGTTFVSGNPLPEYTWKAIYWPLQWTVWLAILSALLCGMLVFDQSLKAYMEIGNNQCECSRSEICKGDGGIYLFILLLEQDKKLISKANGIRILIGFWLLFGIVVTTAYRSKLVSLISFPVLEEGPLTFEALADSSPHKISIMLNDAGPLLPYFKASSNAIVKKIMERVKTEKNPSKCFEQSIGTSRRPCIMLKVIANYVLLRYFTDSTSSKPPPAELRDEINVSPVSIMYPKGSPLKHTFDWTLASAVAFGILEKWNQLDAYDLRLERLNSDLGSKTFKLNYEYDSSHRPLAMHNFIGAFYVLYGGFVISFIVFFVEILKARVNVFVSIMRIASGWLF